MDFRWGYTQMNGPHTWASNVPAARGFRQSPIDIVPSEALYDKTLKNKPLHVSYEPSNVKQIVNTGASFQVAFNSDGSALEGGPLQHQYKIAQFHMHWGKTSETGSEHRLEGQMFAGELHIVHWNADLYNDFAEAAKAENGLCVLGMFIKPGEEHEGMKGITDKLASIPNKADSADFDRFDPACLLPADRERYWTYSGSLTTPPCFESVTWIVFKEPVEVSEEQLTLLRDLHSTAGDEDTDEEDELHGHIIENYRPPLSLNGRLLRCTYGEGD